MTETLWAPWTDEQVANLNAFQQSGRFHPFTCGGEHTPGSPVLVATTEGWVCPQPYGEPCDYRQRWAPAFMAQPLEPSQPGKAQAGGRQPAPLTCPTCGLSYELEWDGEDWVPDCEWWRTDEHAFLDSRHCFLKARGYVFDQSAGRWTKTAVAKAWAGTRTVAVQAQLEVAKTYLSSQAQQGPMFMPPSWTKDGGL